MKRAHISEILHNYPLDEVASIFSSILSVTHLLCSKNTFFSFHKTPDFNQTCLFCTIFNRNIFILANCRFQFSILCFIAIFTQRWYVCTYSLEFFHLKRINNRFISNSTKLLLIWSNISCSFPSHYHSCKINHKIFFVVFNLSKEIVIEGNFLPIVFLK